MKKALILGVTGQDGSYLAEFLLEIGYQVHGIVRRNSSFNTERIDHLSDRLNSGRFLLHHGDINDSLRIADILRTVMPDEIYNLAAQSHVRVSFDIPLATADSVALGSAKLFEAIRQVCPDASVYQASSSEMFGSSPSPQTEQTTFQPLSPYATSKLFAFWTAKNYREAYGISISNGILFNHESPRRGATFVTRKISRAAALISAGKLNELRLGNLDARRDWGYAAEYVIPMWLMTSRRLGVDVVIGTGLSYSIRDFLEACFSNFGLEWENYVNQDARYFRPNEVNDLEADPSLAKSLLNWEARVFAPELAVLMCEHDRIQTSGNKHIVDVVSPKVWGDWT